MILLHSSRNFFFQLRQNKNKNNNHHKNSTDSNISISLIYIHKTLRYRTITINIPNNIHRMTYTSLSLLQLYLEQQSEAQLLPGCSHLHLLTLTLNNLIKWNSIINLFHQYLELCQQNIIQMEQFEISKLE